MTEPSDDDPARTVRLLWGLTEPAGRRGPRRRLDLDRVVATGIALADAEGAAALTMRAVATTLAVAPMTLYSYVPGKGVLLQLMLDRVYDEQPRPDTTGRPWRERVTAAADAHRALFLTHPWAADLSPGRPPPGPGVVSTYEYELGAFDGLGLEDVERDAAVTFLRSFAAGSARDTLAATGEQRASGRTDEQWWAEVGPVVAEVIDPQRFPLAVRIGAAAGAAQGSAYDPEGAYRFGLRRVLDGLARIVERAED